MFLLMSLSVFLFTSCEKETDTISASENKNIVEKFKRLKFQTVPISNGGTTGNFVGFTGGGLNFLPPNHSGPIQFASTTGSKGLFTDPFSSAQIFGVNEMFGQGGGSFTLNGKKVALNFGFCGQDFFGTLDNSFKDDDLDKLDVFIGVAGDFAFDDTGSSPGIDYLLYAISYNGGTKLSSLYDLNKNEKLKDLAFVLLIEFMNEDNAKVYFSKSGNITFSGSQLTLSDISLVDEEGMSANGKLDAALECVNIEQ
jgi:hypothetical protein